MDHKRHCLRPLRTTGKQCWDDLPPVVVETIAVFVEFDTLPVVKRLGLQSDNVFHEVWTRRARLFLPSDETALRSALSVAQSMMAVPNPSSQRLRLTLSSSKMLGGLSEQLYDVIEDLRIEFVERNTVNAPVNLDHLNKFDRLIHLKVTACNSTMDLAALSDAAPQLETLSIKGWVSLVNGLRLSRLHTLQLEEARMVSFKVLVDVPRLRSLTVIAYSALAIDAPDYLDRIPLLQLLVVEADWSQGATQHLVRHAATLTTLRLTCLVREDIPEPSLDLQLAQFVNLVSLQLGDFEVVDLGAVAMLTTLEHLQLVVGAAVTNCRALRRLSNLKELYVTDGWLGDIVGRLSQLHTLACTNYNIDETGAREAHPSPHPRSTFAYPMNFAGHTSQLKRLRLHGNVEVVMSPELLQWLEDVDHLELDLNSWGVRGEAMMFELTKIRRVRLHAKSFGEWVSRGPFRSLASLEALYVHANDVSDVYWPPLPYWVSQCTNLTELKPSTEIPIDFDFPPKLRYVDVEVQRNFPALDGLMLLVHLRVVQIPADASCKLLRRECRAGGALPLLRSIFHSARDCLLLYPTAGHERLHGTHTIEPSWALPTWWT